MSLNIKDDLTVFEPKHPLSHDYRTDDIPLRQTASWNIERLKCYLKDSPVCLDLAYFHPKNKTE